MFPPYTAGFDVLVRILAGEMTGMIAIADRRLAISRSSRDIVESRRRDVVSRPTIETSRGLRRSLFLSLRFLSFRLRSPTMILLLPMSQPTFSSAPEASLVRRPRKMDVRSGTSLIFHFVAYRYYGAAPRRPAPGHRYSLQASVHQERERNRGGGRGGGGEGGGDGSGGGGGARYERAVKKDAEEHFIAIGVTF